MALREMTKDVSGLPVKLRQLAGDCKVHVIHVWEIPEEALQEMDSDLKYVLGLMKRTGSSKKYEAYIRENREYFSRIPRSALDVIDARTNIKDIRGYLQFVRSEEKRGEERRGEGRGGEEKRGEEKRGEEKRREERRGEEKRRDREEADMCQALDQSVAAAEMDKKSSSLLRRETCVSRRIITVLL